MTSATRAPVSVLYGGAHLFSRHAVSKLGAIAQRTQRSYVAAPAALEASLGITADVTPVFDRLVAKLEREPLEDLRIDFEDGYGVRAEQDEDADAARVAEELRAAEVLPPFIGVRVKALNEVTGARAQRTLRLVTDALAGWGRPLTLTFPKLQTAAEARAIAELVEETARRTGLMLGIELMMETRQALNAVAEIAAAAGPRLSALHFGAYDYLSELSVSADDQSLLHPLCDAARVDLVRRSPARVSDGATSLLPLGDAATVQAALALHARHVRHALSYGIQQGWDLHPAQLVARYAAVIAFYRRGLTGNVTRLRTFLANAARARAEGGVFDDAATALGLVNQLLNGLDTGALLAEEVTAVGVPVDVLRSRSFPLMLSSIPGALT